MTSPKGIRCEECSGHLRYTGEKHELANGDHEAEFECVDCGLVETIVTLEERKTKSRGIRIVLPICPVPGCWMDFSDVRDKRAHIEKHVPEELGLSPLSEPPKRPLGERAETSQSLLKEFLNRESRVMSDGGRVDN